VGENLEPRDVGSGDVLVAAEVDEVEEWLGRDEGTESVAGDELVEATVARDGPLPFLECGEEGAAWS
jgi:hypothetical protein